MTATVVVVGCRDCDDTAGCPVHDHMRVRCARCGGTGQFITGSLNGKLTGPGGVCFRCGGKGFHTPADRRRNGAFERHGRRY